MNNVIMEENLKQIRWQQRFNNFDKAFSLLTEALAKTQPDVIQQAGIIQIFEFTFELGWKTIKDYLESENVIAQTPREVIKQAFSVGIIKNGDIWLEALNNRNLLAHTYNEEIASQALSLIHDNYNPILKDLREFLVTKFDKQGQIIFTRNNK